MKNENLIAIIFCISLLSCNGNLKHELDLGNTVAKGDIRDSVYYGYIKFFDKTSGKLVKEGFYDNGILNGEFREYYPNGKLKLTGNYNNGEENGYTYLFDTASNLISKSYNYYGIPVGSNIDYNKGIPQKYYFYSLDNIVLFEMNYDSIGSKGILEIAKNFFFTTSYNLNDTSKKEFRLYNINPPKYKFSYSLVLVDDSLKIKNVLQDLKTNKAWYTFQINSASIPDHNYYAIKLFVIDSINNRDCTMIKILKD